MLHFPPSRINLLMADIVEFKHRQASGHSNHASERKTTNPKIGAVPSRLTRLGIVREVDNIGRNRIASCASEALFCSGLDETTEDLRSQGSGKIEDHEVNDHAQRSDIPSQNGSALAPKALASSNDQHDYRRQLGHFPLQSTLQQLSRSKSSSDKIPISSDLEGEQYHGTAIHQPTNPEPSMPADTSTNSHIQQSRCQTKDFPVDGSSEIRFAIDGAHKVEAEVFKNSREKNPLFSLSHKPDFEALDSKTWSASFLDPSAPAFVPKIKLGSFIKAMGEQSTIYTRRGCHRKSPRCPRATLNLHGLPTATSFVEPPLSVQGRQINLTKTQLLGSPNLEENDSGQPKRRLQICRKVHKSKQKNSLPRPTPNLERYPLLVPPSRLLSSFHTRGSNQPIVPPRRRGSLQYLAKSAISSESTAICKSPVAPRHIPSPGFIVNKSNANGKIHSSPRLCSSSSPSSKNLHQNIDVPRVYARSTSLTWNYSSAHGSSTLLDPNVSNVASGFQELFPVKAPKVSTDAVQELMFMRNSPLEELTQRLVWMGTHRPRSVNRSFIPSPETGRRNVHPFSDPFRQDAEFASSLTSDESLQSGPSELPTGDEIPNDCDTSTNTFLPLSDLPLPTNQHGSQDVSNTLSSSPLKASSPHSPYVKRSPDDKASPSINSPTESTQNAKTPKIRVYDDSKPPGTQPKTPADVQHSRSNHKAKGCLPSHSGKESSPTTPERCRHRYTYPPVNSSQYSACILAREPSSALNTDISH